MIAFRAFVLSLIVTAPFASAALPGEASRLVVNEVLYDPSGPDAGREAFEIHNPGLEPVSLEGWTATDGDLCRPDPAGALVAGSIELHGVVPPLGHVVVALPAFGGVPKCLSLANGGDDLEIRDAEGRPVDRLAWGPGGKEGRSLQRCAVVGGAAHAEPSLGSANAPCVPA